VRIGIWCFNNDPGLVCVRPRNVIRFRSPASIRSIVAAEIPANRPAWASSMSISASARSKGTRTGMNGARIFPAGARNSVQHRVRAGSRSSP